MNAYLKVLTTTWSSKLLWMCGYARVHVCSVGGLDPRCAAETLTCSWFLSLGAGMRMNSQALGRVHLSIRGQGTYKNHKSRGLDYHGAGLQSLPTTQLCQPSPAQAKDPAQRPHPTESCLVSPVRLIIPLCMSFTISATDSRRCCF